MKYRVQVEYSVDMDVEGDSFADVEYRMGKGHGLMFQFAQEVNNAGRSVNADCVDWRTVAIIDPTDNPRADTTEDTTETP